MVMDVQQQQHHLAQQQHRYQQQQQQSQQQQHYQQAYNAQRQAPSAVSSAGAAASPDSSSGSSSSLPSPVTTQNNARTAGPVPTVSAMSPRGAAAAAGAVEAAVTSSSEEAEMPSPQSVGREFVRQYYTLLNQSPLHLHRFYSHNSSFIHGGIDSDGVNSSVPVRGQQEIHTKIMQLNFRDCHAKIRQVDAHATLENGVVVQVTGELSNNGEPMRRFMQTFVLAPQSHKKYYVHNDIFRYQDTVFGDDSSADAAAAANTANNNGAPQNGGENNGQQQPINSSPVQQQPNNSNGLQQASNLPQPDMNANGNLSVASGPPVVSAAPGFESVVVPQQQQQQQQQPEAQPQPQAPKPRGGGTPTVSVAAVTNMQEQQQKVEEPVRPVVSVQPQQQQGVTVGPPPGMPTQKPAEHVAAFEQQRQQPQQQQPLQESKPEPEQAAAPKPKEEPETGEPAPKAAAPSALAEPLSYANRVKSGAGAAMAGVPVAQAAVYGAPTAAPQLTTQKPPAAAAAAPKSSSQEAAPPPYAGGRGGYRGARGGSGGGAVRGGGRERYGSSSRDNEQERADRRPLRSTVSGDGGGGHFSSGVGGGERPPMGPPRETYPDSQQVFVGNLPHNCTERDLENLFSKYGKVAEIRINNKGVAQTKAMPQGTRVPNFGFVVFESASSTTKCLNDVPINLPPDNHRLNVEEKKPQGKIRQESLGGGRGYDRGSQEHLGGVGRGADRGGRGGPGGMRGRGSGGGYRGKKPYMGGGGEPRGGGGGPPMGGGGGGQQ